MPTSSGERPPALWLRLLLGFAPFLALGGLVLSLVPDFLTLHRSPLPGVDFRVLYVSEQLFAHGQDPYEIASFAAVYTASGFPVPASLFGHMPVYPDATFALLLPLSLLSGAAALWLWLVLSAFAMACALAALSSFAHRQLALSATWRLLLIALCAAFPLLAFGLQIGNVSVLVAALCILAVCCFEQRPIGAFLALAVALVLKPHLALWILLALSCFWGPGGRRAAWRGLLAAVAFSLAELAVQALHGRAFASMQHFLALVASEQHAGSMSPNVLEKLFVGAQITDLATLPGFFQLSPGTGIGLRLLVAASVALVLEKVNRARNGAPWPASQSLHLTALLVATGMATTYHRAHDATLLLLLAPSLLVRLRHRWLDPQAIALLVGFMALSFEPLGAWGHPAHGHGGFLVYRQAAITTFLITALLAILALQTKKGGMDGILSMPGGQ